MWQLIVYIKLQVITQIGGSYHQQGGSPSLKLGDGLKVEVGPLTAIKCLDKHLNCLDIGELGLIWRDTHRCV